MGLIYLYRYFVSKEIQISMAKFMAYRSDDGNIKRSLAHNISKYCNVCKSYMICIVLKICVIISTRGC